MAVLNSQYCLVRGSVAERSNIVLLLDEQNKYIISGYISSLLETLFKKKGKLFTKMSLFQDYMFSLNIGLIFNQKPPSGSSIVVAFLYSNGSFTFVFSQTWSSCFEIILASPSFNSSNANRFPESKGK